MSTNLSTLSELESILSNDEKTTGGILHYISSFDITRLLHKFDVVKRKGSKVSLLLASLIIFRLRGESIPVMLRQRFNFMPKIDDNTFYRLLNNPLMNWRTLLLGFAKQFAKHVNKAEDSLSKITCFVLDDTDLHKTGKTIEFIGRIHNHATDTYPLGFKMLLLSFFDGKSLFSLDFSLHREKGKKGNYGLSIKELKARFSKKRDKKSPADQRVKELDICKNQNAIAMLKRAVKNGFIASYVLMDSWFVSDNIIKSIRAIKNGAMHVLGMSKMDNRKYLIDSKERSAKQLIAKYDRTHGHYSRKYKSHYISLAVNYKGEDVRLFLIRYKNAKSWSVLLTTDISLSFVKAIEIYQIRWTIEVLFKECKQYLRLGGSQNTDFDGQIADTTLALITHTILTLHKRFHAYETLGELFRATQQHLIEMTLWERLIKVLLKIVLQMIEILSVDMEDVICKIMKNDKASYQLRAMITALAEMSDNDLKTHENDIAFPMAS